MLKDKFNVDEKEDFINLYFHFPYGKDTVTLHMHIRVNQGFHPLEKAQAISYDEVIKTLENGVSVADYLIHKSKNEDGFYVYPGLKLCFEGMGIPYKDGVKNPFLLESMEVENPLHQNLHSSKTINLNNMPLSQLANNTLFSIPETSKDNKGVLPYNKEKARIRIL